MKSSFVYNKTVLTLKITYVQHNLLISVMSQICIAKVLPWRRFAKLQMSG
jgi:hypothetical protein